MLTKNIFCSKTLQKPSQMAQFKLNFNYLCLFCKNTGKKENFCGFSAGKSRSFCFLFWTKSRDILLPHRIIYPAFHGVRKKFQKNFSCARKSTIFGALNKAGKNSLYITLYSTAFLGAELHFPTEARILAEFRLKRALNPPRTAQKTWQKNIKLL